MNAVQCLLRNQTEGKLLGWQNTQLEKCDAFKLVPSHSPFIQILHVSECHWAVVSNLKVKERGPCKESITYYDSLLPGNVTPQVRKTVCSFFKSDSSVIHFDIANIMRQPNTNDCGVFAATIATELAHFCDPTVCKWDSGQLRKHLLNCLEAQKMTRFPTVGKRRIGFGSQIRKSIPEKLYCSCRMLNDKSRPMIACDHCTEWYHKDCVNLDTDKSYEDESWECKACLDLLHYMKS